MLSRLAIPFLAALLLQATPLQMSLLLVADVVSAALGSLWLGGLVDRAGKRAVMLACDGLRALTLALLASAAWFNQVGMLALLAASAANGLLTMGFELARSAWIAQTVEAYDLPRRNAQLSMTGSLSETAAFALGGWLYQGLGATLALAVDALSYAASALCLRGVREVRVASSLPMTAVRATWRRAWDDAAIGLRTVTAQPSLRALAGIEMLVAGGMSLYGSCFMIYVARDIGMDTGPLGMIFAVGGLGALTGGWLAPTLGRRFGAGRAMASGLALLALGSWCAPAATQAGALAVVLLVLQQIIGDGGRTVHDVHDRSLRQTLVPPELLARADAGIRAVGQAATLGGALLGGLLGEHFGARWVLLLAAGLFMAAAALALVRLAPLHRAN
jgi:MFS family permease